MNELLIYLAGTLIRGVVIAMVLLAVGKFSGLRNPLLNRPVLVGCLILMLWPFTGSDIGKMLKSTSQVTYVHQITNLEAPKTLTLEAQTPSNNDTEVAATTQAVPRNSDATRIRRTASKHTMQQPQIAMAQPEKTPNYTGYIPLALLLIWLSVSMVRVVMLARKLRYRKTIKNLIPVVNERIQDIFEFCGQKLRHELPPECLLDSDDTASGICAFGIYKTGVIVPEETMLQLDDHKVKMILTHELVHLKRRDPIWFLVLEFLKALLWFNPAIYYLTRLFRRESELFCDKEVIKIHTGNSSQRMIYGDLLFNLSVHTHSCLP